MVETASAVSYNAINNFHFVEIYSNNIAIKTMDRSMKTVIIVLAQLQSCYIGHQFYVIAVYICVYFGTFSTTHVNKLIDTSQQIKYNLTTNHLEQCTINQWCMQ